MSVAEAGLNTDVARYVQRRNRDLTRPSAFDPIRWVLIGLHRKLVRIVEDLPASGQIVDYGCGLMPYRDLMRQKFEEYIGADLDGNRLADITIAPDGTLPLPDASADGVLSSQVLEHVPDPAAYLAEAHRVLRPSGHLILSTHGIWVYHRDPTDYWRWTPDGLRLIVTRADFRVTRMESVLSLPSVALQLGLNATYRSMPGVLRHVWSAAVQSMIGVIEHLRGDAFSWNALDYVVVARRE